MTDPNRILVLFNNELQKDRSIEHRFEDYSVGHNWQSTLFIEGKQFTSPEQSKKKNARAACAAMWLRTRREDVHVAQQHSASAPFAMPQQHNEAFIVHCPRCNFDVMQMKAEDKAPSLRDHVYWVSHGEVFRRMTAQEILAMVQPRAKEDDNDSVEDTFAD